MLVLQQSHEQQQPVVENDTRLRPENDIRGIKKASFCKLVLTILVEELRRENIQLQQTVATQEQRVEQVCFKGYCMYWFVTVQGDDH